MLKSFVISVALSLFVVTVGGCQSAGPKYQNVRSYSEGLAAAQASNGRWGFVNEQQVWVIPAKFEDAKGFSNGKAAVRMNGRWGFINRRGEWL